MQKTLLSAADYLELEKNVWHSDEIMNNLNYPCLAMGIWGGHPTRTDGYLYYFVDLMEKDGKLVIKDE